MPSFDQRQLEQLAHSVRSLRSGKYSDFTIRCSDSGIIRAHRAIVCPRSRVLSAAVDGVFKEAVSQEIVLDEEEPPIVAKMIDFLYCLDYDDNRLDIDDQPPTSRAYNSIPPPVKFTFGEGTGTGSIPTVSGATVAEQPTGLNSASLVVNAKIYIIADKYDIQALKEWAVAKYKEVLPATWHSTSFIESASLVFENTPESDRMLREVIIRKASENAKDLFDRGEFVALLQSRGDFAAEVLRDAVFNQSDDVHEEEPGAWGFGTTTKKEKKKNRF